MTVICIYITPVLIVLIHFLKICKEYKRQLVMFNKGKCKKCGSELVYFNDFKGRVYSCGNHYMTYVTFRSIDREFTCNESNTDRIIY